MLEAERAGARALVVFMESYPRNSHEWKLLRKIHEDEAHNCALIGEQLKRLGKDYSHATGEFYAKAVAVNGQRERIEFLVRGLKWAIREFEQALPGIRDPEIEKLFRQMRQRHLHSVSLISGGLLPG